MKRAWPSLVALLALLLVAWWPALSASQAVGHPVGDLADHYWGTWWFGSEILAGRFPDTTNVSHFPSPRALWYVDPLGGLLSLPLRLLGFPLAYNGMVLVQVLLASLAAWWTGSRLTASTTSGLVAGVVVGASPYMLGLGSSGLTEYLGLGAVVMYCWWMLRALGRLGDPPDNSYIVAGVLLALCAVQAFYYAAFAAALLGVATLGEGAGQRLGRAVKVGVVAAVCTAPWFWIAWSTLSAENAAISAENAPGWNFHQMPATDLLTFFRPGDYTFPNLAALGNPGIVHVNYLGWVVLALAAYGAGSALTTTTWAGGIGRDSGVPVGRTLSRVALAWFALCLGPILCVGGVYPSTNASPMPLPLSLLYLPGSPFRMVHHPYRLVAFLLPLLAWLAALGALRLPRWARYAAAAAVVAEAVLLSAARWPLPSTPVEAPVVYSELGEGPVLDWPPDATEWNRRYEIWQVEHGRPNPYGVNTFLVDEVRAAPLVAALIRTLDDPKKRTVNRDVHLRIEPLPPGPGLYELGYRWLVLHREALGESELAKAEGLLKKELGESVFADEATEAWAIR